MTKHEVETTIKHLNNEYQASKNVYNNRLKRFSDASISVSKLTDAGFSISVFSGYIVGGGPSKGDYAHFPVVHLDFLINISSLDAGSLLALVRPELDKILTIIPETDLSDALYGFAGDEGDT